MRVLLALTLSRLLLPSIAEGQAAPRYQPLMLDCARYQLDARATIISIAGKERTRESTGRIGVLVVRGAAAPGDSMLELTAWFDSLAMFREGESERLEPDTDGLIGGRYGASLSPSGVSRSTELPFFPDDVLQVSDLSTTLTALFPQLPPKALMNGAGWRDDFGTVITRLGDMTLGGRRVERYRLSRKSSRPVQEIMPDSSTVTANRNESEEGIFYWSNDVGLVRWERDLTDELVVEKGGVVKQAFRTVVEQKITVERLAGMCSR